LLRPRISIDASLRSVLDPDELAAVQAHELAHARHRDPFRIWVAQLAADLQWPAPHASTRLRIWLHALELARDEEAREAGVDGLSLAGAIVNVARLAQTRCGIVARLVGEREMMRDRVSRLLRPLASARVPGVLLGATILLACASAVLVGLTAGDALLHYIPGVSTV
jgi:beta-lactamase regulating signal transducer with metallopeptidase domain